MISLILVQNKVDNLREYLKQCKLELKNFLQSSDKYELSEIIVVTTTPLKISLKDVKVVVVNANNDYQQMVCAGLEESNGRCVIFGNSNYSPSIYLQMLNEHLQGNDIVCLKKKLNKFQQLFATIGQGIYNLTLRLIGRGLFSMGIIKDIQLVSGELIDLLKENQSIAHRIRTMYALYEYKTSYISMDLEQTKTEEMLTPTRKWPFYIGASFSMLFVLVLIGAITTFIVFQKSFIWYFLSVILFIPLEAISLIITMNSIARIKIGTLHQEDRFGRIYIANK